LKARDQPTPSDPSSPRIEELAQAIACRRVTIGTDKSPEDAQANVYPDLTIEGCRILFPEAEISSITVAGGKIASIGDGAGDTECLDAGGRVVTPGLVDVHVQGAGGADVLDANWASLQTMSRTCARFGVTGLLATTVFRPDGHNKHIEIASRAVGRDLGGAAILGLHLEGPFISPEKRGMIRQESICKPSKEALDRILELSRGKLKMMTLAPEIPGNDEVIAELTLRGILPSFGHSDASYDQTISGFEQGISHVTHLFNAMPQIHHRKPGPLLAILESDVTAQLIADGVHVHPAVVRWSLALMGDDRIVPITDGMRAMGLPDGRYVYDGLEYESSEGSARYEDGTLVGTTLGMNSILERLSRFTGCRRDTAIKMASHNAAEIIGMQSTKGSIEPGKDADLVIWDRDFDVWSTIVGGKIVYSAFGSR